MSTAAEWALSRRIRINANLSVDLTVGPCGAVAEWIGGQPRYLTEVEKRRYRRGRDQLISEFANKTGGTVAVLEIQP